MRRPVGLLFILCVGPISCKPTIYNNNNICSGNASDCFKMYYVGMYEVKSCLEFRIISNFASGCDSAETPNGEQTTLLHPTI